MADALKAEGNKLFAEKKFAESMYVAPRLVRGRLLWNLPRPALALCS
jgi:hypothetical protein